MTELTVPFNDRLAGPYVATLGQTVFPYDFPITAPTDLHVVRRRAGVEAVLTYGFEYTVTGVGAQAGGTIVLMEGHEAETADIVVIYGAEQLERNTNFQPPPSSPNAVDFNVQLNSLIMQVQQLATLAGRSLRLKDTDSFDDMRLPLEADRASKLLGFDADGKPVALAPGGTGPQGPPGPAGALSAASSVDLTRIADPAAPGAGIDRLYSDASGRLAAKDPGGVKHYVTARPEFSVWVDGQAQALANNDSSGAAKTANKTAIQAAMDFAIDNAKQRTHLSAGVIYSDPGLYLDAPGNLRVNEANPTIFNFSALLEGAGGLGNHEGHGTQLRFTDNTVKGLILGSGQGMAVKGLSVLGPSGHSSRAALPANGVGIALSGGSGGLSRATLEDVMVENFRQSITTGANNNALCDALTFRDVHVRQCYRGLSVLGTQNYIINLEGSCVFSDCTQHIYSPVGKPVNVRGGNYSTTDAKKNAFTIGSTSALSSFTDTYVGSNFTNWTFTTTLASDDQPMIDGAYDALGVKLTGFGVVPLLLTNYNSGTRVATLKFYPGWLTAHYPAVNIKTVTDIETELAAATLLYACEMVTPFFGTGFNVDGAHIENPGVLTRLISTEHDFVGDRVSKFSKLFCNYYINHFDLSAGSNAQKAVFFLQQVFPWVRVVRAGVVMEDCKTIVDPHVGLGKDGVNVEVIGNTPTHRFISRNNDLFHPNITTPLWSPFDTDSIDFYWPSMVRGAGEWDSTPFLPGAETKLYYAAGRVSHAPFRGFSPSPETTPRIRRAVFDALAATPGSPGSLGTYPSLHGQTVYSILDDVSGSGFEPIGPVATLLARSCHQHWSYGQDLTLAANLSYKGKTHIANVPAADMPRMYAGLKIILDNGGGDVGYLVTGVHPTLGYITAVNLNAPDQLLAGTSTTTYNIATIKQQAYSIARTGLLPASKDVTNNAAGATTAAVGDLTGAHLVNLLLTAVGAANFTTRTAAQMFADIPGAFVGMKHDITIRNTNAGTTTLVGGTGVTISGTATIAQNVKRRFEVVFTSATAVTITNRDAVTTV